MEKFKKRAILNGLGIIGILGATTALILMYNLNVIVLIGAVISCYPMAKYLWHYAIYVRYNTLRILRKALPKAGFLIEHEEWDDSHTTVKFHGKYQGDYFLVQAVVNSPYILIWDLPWQNVDAKDPRMPYIMEALNEVNTLSSNMTVAIDIPEEDGIRQIYTVARSPLPPYHSEQYLDSLMCEMLKRKPAFVEALNRERPYMVQSHGPVGFNVHNASTCPEEVASPAAKSNSEVK